MKNEMLLDAIGKIDDELVCGAVGNLLKRSKRRIGWRGWAAMAACLALAVSAGARFLAAGRHADRLADGLPVLTVSENWGEGAGFEGYMVYDISELANANPWCADAGITTLPVYRNTLSFDEYHIAFGVNHEAMKSILLQTAERLDMDGAELQISDNVPSADKQAVIMEKQGWCESDVPDGYFDPTEFIVEGNGVTLTVDVFLTAQINFQPAAVLPDGYDFSYDSSRADMESVAGYLKDAYHGLLDMERPQAEIYSEGYDINMRNSYHIRFYDAAGDMTEQIINYNFNRTAFYCNDEGNLYMARIYQPDLSDKAGDYPIISAEEATELLLGGNYLSTVPYEISGRESIAKTELIYRTGSYEKYYMPYYRFYVELTDMTVNGESGIKHYGAYYVPAVNGAYLGNTPVWNGGMNEM